MNSFYHTMGPLDQFEIRDLSSLHHSNIGSLDHTFSNFYPFMLLLGLIASIGCLLALRSHSYPIQSVNADSTLGEAHGLARQELRVENKPKKRDYQDNRAWANPMWADVPSHVNPSNKEEEVAFFDLRHRNGQSLRILFSPTPQHRSCHLNIDGRDV